MPEVTKLACSVCGRTDREMKKCQMILQVRDTGEPEEILVIPVDLCVGYKTSCENRAIKFMHRACTPPAPRKAKASSE